MTRLIKAPLLFAFVLSGTAALGQKPKGEPEVEKELQPLVKQLKDKEAKKRYMAAVELGEKGEAAASAATALCEALMDSSPRVAEAALVALEKSRPDLYKHLSVMILDQDRHKQFTAIAGMGLLGEKAAPAMKLLLVKLRADSVSLRAIGEDRFSRGESIDGVRVNRPDSALLVLMSAIERIDEGNADVHKMRKMLAGVGNKDDLSRLDASDALIKWAGEDQAKRKEILPLIGAMLQDQQLAIPAMERLAAYGKLAKEYLPTLKRLKLSSDEKIRTAATKAVDAIEDK